MSTKSTGAKASPESFPTEPDEFNDDEVERALLQSATGYTVTGFKIRRRHGNATLVPVQETFGPNRLARAIVSKQRRGGRALLRELDKAKRGKW